jgi:trans-2,3-dihydro-3-hydroxyanthranilate isomerase
MTGLQTTLDYCVVDVFTEVAFAGNPLAVVLGGEELDSGQMQVLAREFHLSETAFPLRPSPQERARGVDYRLRIFTPEVELPFAGHPSVGTAWVLHRLGWIGEGSATQACGAGDLAVVVSATGAELTGGQPTASDPIDPEPLLAAVRLGRDDVDDALGAPPRVCGTGIGFAMLPVRLEALARCDPDPALLRGFAHPVSDATGVYVVAWDGESRVARARMFAGDVGVPEDPATGSAALGLGVWLAESGLLATDRVADSGSGVAGSGDAGYTVLQGLEMGRPSRLNCRVQIVGGVAVSARVRGGVVDVARGSIAIPAAG